MKRLVLPTRLVLVLTELALWPLLEVAGESHGQAPAGVPSVCWQCQWVPDNRCAPWWQAPTCFVEYWGMATCTKSSLCGDCEMSGLLCNVS